MTKKAHKPDELDVLFRKAARRHRWVHALTQMTLAQRKIIETQTATIESLVAERKALRAELRSVKAKLRRARKRAESRSWPGPAEYRASLEGRRRLAASDGPAYIQVSAQ
ncbi:MAG: hypothetical protein ACYDAD_14190 [Acidimicrobiales bacterium]